MTDAAQRNDRRTSRQHVGRYELVARLAIGGMGELFLAREQGIAGFERLVAIKRILPNLAARNTFREMFLREARILARLSHPNVVQTVELGEDRGNYYLVLEYIRGSTLRELLVLAGERNVAVPADFAVAAVVQGLRGLHAAHELTDLKGKLLGTVHRDVSPHNLMCTPEGNVKLFDFGVAKASEHGELTYSGMLKGKFAYMSPEQCRRQPIDRRSDIFAMGIVLWEMLAGERLFKREAEIDTMNAIASGDIPALAELRDDLPELLVEAAEKALRVDRNGRHATAADFEQALLTAADEAGWDVSARSVADFVNEVAHDRLESRANTLAAAVERALTASERAALVHATGSHSMADVLDQDIEETIQVSPLSLLTPQTETEPSRAQARARVGVGTILTVGVVLTLLAIGATFIGPSGKPLRIVWAPSIEPDVLLEELEPVRVYLEGALDRPVTLRIASSYQDAADRITDGRADLATLPPYTYVKTKEREPAIEPLVSKIFDGSKSSEGLILVPFESTAKKLADLKGKTWCFPDENSTTGYMLPRAFLRQQGHDPDTFVGAIKFSGDHLTVLKDLLGGRCQVGATYSGNLLTAAAQGVSTGKLRQFATTGQVPHGTLTAAPDLPAAERKAVVEALLAFDPHACCDADYIGESQRITGFSPQFDEGYEQLRRGLGIHR